MTWQKILSYKTQKIMSNFCFDTKWRVKPNNILLSISFIVDVILVCRVILQSFPNSRIFLELFGIYISFDSLNRVSLDDQMEIPFLIDVGICLRILDW